MPKYKHLLDDSKMSIIDINVLLHQTPGGMLSNLVNQLREMDALDKIDEVYKELPRVRKELGQIPLVTPTSQIVGIQTVNNVLFDDENERYKMITGQVKGPVLRPVRQDGGAHRCGGAEKGLEGLRPRRGAHHLPSGGGAGAGAGKGQGGDRGSGGGHGRSGALRHLPGDGQKFLKWKYGKEEAAGGGQAQDHGAG
jgi:pyruvate carboxylase subunit B